MAPDNEARPQAAFYDHESEEPRRRRRPAADWGVGEDIFDRMPSRFARRGEHRDEIVAHRAEDERPSRSREVASWGEDAWADDAPAPRRDRASHARRVAGRGCARHVGRRGRAARRAMRDTWGDEDRTPRGATMRDTWSDEDRAPRHGNTRVTRDASWGDEPRGVDVRETWGDEDRAPRVDAAREVEPWHEDDEPDFGGHMVLAEKPQVDSWMDDAPLVPGESRTIVLGTDESSEPARHEEPKERRTVVISGHPDRVPAVRPQRPPRSAVERIGTSPDRIVAYAVALGFLLVLIAVLTTGQ